jgi:hypothetical protein
VPSGRKVMKMTITFFSQRTSGRYNSRRHYCLEGLDNPDLKDNFWGV